jgi:hypothetical protein
MQTLYGNKISDRVTVEHDPISGRYAAFFDGEDTGVREYSGVAAVSSAITWLNNRAKRLAEEAQREEEAEKQAQYNTDEAFLYDLSDRLGINKDDLDTLMQIAARRTN